jgi:hypothetical protein
MITFRRLGYASLFLLVGLLSLEVSPVLAHHSATPYKWSTIPVDVDISSSSFPSSWITPLSRSLSTWNYAGSRFRFRSANTGHTLYRTSWGQGAIAQTTTLKNSANVIYDADTAFNTSYSWCDGAYSGCYDIQNAMTHELGHWLYLYDLYGSSDTENTMYYKIVSAEIKKRSLEWDDIYSIKNMYPN